MKTLDLLWVLDQSCRRNGSGKPLTIGHLRNIVKMVKRIEEGREAREEQEHFEILNEIDPLGQG